MSDPRITPRAAAFQQQASLEHAQAEHANALVTHGDPSIRAAQARSGESLGEDAARGDRVRVEWVYATDVTRRVMSAGMSRGAELYMRLHAWLREQGSREITFRRPGRDPVPPASDFGQDVPQRQAPGIDLNR